MFPRSLPEFFIKTLTKRGDVVFDPFAGGGTTGLAAIKLGRWFLGCDIKQEYVDLANERLRQEFPLLKTSLGASCGYNKITEQYEPSLSQS